MTLANWLALGGAMVVLGLVVSRPRLGFIALAAFYPLNDYVPRSPLPGLNWETVITSLAVGVTLLRFGFRTPPLRFSAPVTCYILILFIGFLVIASWAPARIPGFSSFENLKVAKSAAFTAVLFFPMYFWPALSVAIRTGELGNLGTGGSGFGRNRGRADEQVAQAAAALRGLKILRSCDLPQHPCSIGRVR